MYSKTMIEMKKLIYSIFMLTAMFMTSCSDDKAKDVIPADRGTVTDDDGNVYQWVTIGDLQWTTSNAKNGENVCNLRYWNGWSWSDALSDSEKAEFMENTYPVYGNYMTYDEALESAPEGWRLPTDEDWQKLEAILGMKNTDTEGMRGNIGYTMQQSGTGCELGLQAGGGFIWEAVYGWKELNLGEKEEFGYYWTSTPSDPIDENPQAYYRKICSVNSQVGRNHTGTDRLFSVRWVRDAK